MKKILFITLICNFILFHSSASAIEIKLTDIENHWAKENIIRMVINEKLNGYPDNTFKPNDEITALEFSKMMIDNLNVPLEKEGLRKWPDYYMATAKKKGIETDFSKKINRYEMAEIISNFITLDSIKVSSNPFKDLDRNFQSKVLPLVKLNIVKGYDDKTYRGKNHLTRAEAVTIITRTKEVVDDLNKSKKVAIDSKYTNVGREETENSEIDKIRYEIKDDKIFFYDLGRFSDVQGYTIDEKYITNQKLIKIIQKLISENSYIAVYYIPSKYIINQVSVLYGESDNKINQNLEYFSLTYFEDKLYDLNRVTLRDEFSNECYMKVKLKKLWKENYQRENGIFIDEEVKDKLLQALKIEFGNEAEKIEKYLLEKYESICLSNNEMVEQVVIGKYIINAYKTDAMSLEFYFEKLSS